MTQPLGIIRMGIFCPVGLDAEQASSSIWAGVPRKRETWLRSLRHGRIVMGHLPRSVLPPLVEPLEELQPALTDLQRRLLSLATPALHETLGVEVPTDVVPGAARPQLPSSVLPPGLKSLPPLLVAGPQPVPGQPELMTEQFIERAVLQTGVPIDASMSQVFATGHAGCFAALRHAETQVFDTGRAEMAVIGGVDSYVDLERVRLLEQEGRLQLRGPQDAMVPGEASAFVLVAPREVCRHRGLKPLAWIESVGVAQEPGHRYSEEPHRGDGLSMAISQAFEHRALHVPPVRLVMSGLTGERLPAKEWGVGYLRNREHFADPLRIEHSAQYTGDAGAALAPLMLVAAVFALRRGDAEGPALVWASSDREQRGALIVQAA